MANKEEKKNGRPKTAAELMAMFDFVGKFNEGLAAVKKGNQWFHIHPDGKAAYKARFSWTGRFNGGKASASQGYITFNIDVNGERVG